MVRSSMLLVGLLFASGATAHTGLAGSEPAAGASVVGPVTEIVLTFADEVRLTAVALADAGGTAKALGPLPKDAAAHFVIAVEEPLAPGQYEITWRAVGADTHVVSGKIAFSVGSVSRAP